ncbi:MAG: polysaccharide pyruvyl transferase family protein [Fibrobacterota bacterium]
MEDQVRPRGGAVAREGRILKVGILTFHRAPNAGAVLQAFALQTTLRRMGHQVEFIDYEPRRKHYLREFVGKGAVKTLHKLEDRFREFRHGFSDSYHRVLCKGGTRYRSIEDLRASPPPYEAYIAGSDQIWNVGSRGKIDRVYYLDFGPPSIRRVAYAASFGQCSVPSALEQEITSLLDGFDAIGVRESNGARFASELLAGRNPVAQVMDPTFLLTPGEYAHIVETCPGAQGSLVTYILAEYHPPQLQILERVRNRLGTRHLNLRNPDTCVRLGRSVDRVVDPYRWLGAISEARFVLCSSFHAVVFSLLYHRDFLAVSPYPNARVQSLLALVGLEGRFMTEFAQDAVDRAVDSRIDWNRVDMLLAEHSSDSLGFLEKTLV